MVAAALAGVVLFVAAWLIWFARLMHVGNLDVQAALLVALGRGDDRSPSLLSRWCSTRTSVSPARRGAWMELRRRQSLERVHAVPVAEGTTPSADD